MGLRNGPGRWPSDLHIVLFLGRCPRLVWAGPLALGIALLPFSWGVAPGWYSAGRWPSEPHIVLFLGRCPRLIWAGPLALGIALLPFSWGVAPGWYGAGRWPLESHYYLFPGALPQAGMGRAVGPGTAHRPFPGALPQAGMARAVGPCAWLTLGRARALKPRFIWATASRRSRP